MKQIQRVNFGNTVRLMITSEPLTKKNNKKDKKRSSSVLRQEALISQVLSQVGLVQQHDCCWIRPLAVGSSFCSHSKTEMTATTW